MATDPPRKLRLGIYDVGTVGGSTRYLNDLLPALLATRFEVVWFPKSVAARRAIPPRNRAGDFAGVADQHATAGARPPISKASGRVGRLWRWVPSSWRLGVGLARETWALRREIKRESIDLFHSNYAGFEFATIAARLAGVKSIVAVYHNLPSEEYTTRPWLQRFWENWSARCAGAVVAVSQATQREWEQRCPSLRHRFQLIYYGVDAASLERAAGPAANRAALGLADDARVLAVVARLHPMKGIAVLLDAMPAILSEHPRAQLLLVGDGPQRVQLEQQAARLGLRDCVHFLGWRDDVPRLLRACDVAVLPSVNLETFGYALAEAMALAKPVVASDVGGMPELVEHGHTGWIVPRRDVAALATAINRLLADPELARRFGEAGRRRIESVFPVDKMQRETIGLYESLWARQS